jgi:hypothetical protein
MVGNFGHTRIFNDDDNRYLQIWKDDVIKGVISIKKWKAEYIIILRKQILLKTKTKLIFKNIA